MIHVIGIVVSSFFLSISQPLTNYNGWMFESASAASSHCSCACCKGKVCHCGMEKTQVPGSSKSSKPVGQCCGKTKHFPEPQNNPILIASSQNCNELLKNLSNPNEAVALFELPKSQSASPMINISPHITSIQSFPLRV